jgi:nucleotide-binding universal stress UspA family protein
MPSHQPVRGGKGDPVSLADGYTRKYLVLIDDSPECDRAVSFAAHRVKRIGGTLVLMSVIDASDFDQFIGVADTMRAEARDEAERNLDARIARIAEIGQIRTETVIREGRPAEAIEQVIAADPGIGILVIAAGVGDKGPGPLVGHFSAHNRLHILVAIVPCAMTEEEIVAVA